MKRQCIEWEKIFAFQKYLQNDATDKGLVSKIYKQLMWFNVIRKNPTKNGQKTLTDISPRETYRRPTGT